MIDDLLEAITFWLADLKDIQANSIHIDVLMTELETKADDVEMNISGLEKNIQQIDERLASVLACVLENSQKKNLIQKVI